jgi:hypothetical protein
MHGPKPNYFKAQSVPVSICGLIVMQKRLRPSAGVNV